MSSNQPAKKADMGDTRHAKQRPYDRVNHFETEARAVDAAAEQRRPLRALRGQIGRAARRLTKALGASSGLWLVLEESLTDLRLSREVAFDLVGDRGRVHGRILLQRPRQPTASAVVAFAKAVWGGP